MEMLRAVLSGENGSLVQLSKVNNLPSFPLVIVELRKNESTTVYQASNRPVTDLSLKYWQTFIERPVDLSLNSDEEPSEALCNATSSLNIMSLSINLP